MGKRLKREGDKGNQQTYKMIIILKIFSFHIKGNIVALFVTSHGYTWRGIYSRLIRKPIEGIGCSFKLMN